ncbi:MAG: SprT family zinc-dependent metalloprotease [Burkholderiaceae bacterium]
MAANEQLSLFGGLAAPAASSDKNPAVPQGPVQQAGTAKTELSAVPIARPAALPPGSRWLEIDTPHQTIGFVMRTSRRKTIGLTINDDGLMVTAPAWVPRRQVAEAVQAKAPWILNKLQALHQRQQHLATADASWRNGGSFPYLGTYIQLAVRPAIGVVSFSGDALAPQQGDTLSLPLQADATSDRIRERVYAWLQQQATQLFDARLAHFCKLAGSTLKSWRLASPNGRWGSCTSDGRIMLNWRLIHFAPDVVDYVVAHEVAHLRHMNHGPDFWREVERLHPDFGRARLALKPHHPGSLPLL